MTDHLPPDILREDASLLDLARELRHRPTTASSATKAQYHDLPTMLTHNAIASVIADQIEAYLAERYLATKGTSE